MDPHVKRTVLTKFGGWSNSILDSGILDRDLISNSGFEVANG